MKTDLYTKAVLTVIAIALSAIALQNALPSAIAQSGIQKVVVCENLYNCASVDGGGLRVSTR